MGTPTYEEWKAQMAAQAAASAQPQPQVSPAAAPAAQPPKGAGRVAIETAADAGRGLMQGILSQFADELAGAGSYIGTAIGNVIYSNDDFEAGLDPRIKTRQQSAKQAYQEGRDDWRAKDHEARKRSPWAYGISEAAGGIATAPLAPAAKGIGGAAKIGAGMGAAAGLGASESDSVAGDVVSTLGGAAIGGGLGAAGGWVGAKLGGKTAAARKIAAEVAENADQPSAIGHTTTQRSFLEKSAEIEGRAGQKLFSPAEMVGDPALALKESKAAQFPKTMRTSQAAEASLLRNTAAYLDTLVDRVAADPSKLGRADVGDAMANAVTRHFEAIKQARTAAAKPLYERAERLLGNKHVAPIDEVSSYISTELERSVGPFQASAAPLKQTLDVLVQNSKGGLANIKVVRALAEKWGQQAEGTGDLLRDLPIAQRKFVAGKMAELLNRAIDSAAESGQATDAGIHALREAQAAWRSHSQAIDELATQAVEKVLRVGSGDAGDTLTAKMLRMSPEEMTGVMRVVNKADPKTAQQLRAQVFEDILVSGGKPARGASYAGEIGATELKAQTTLSALIKAEPTLRAMYAGDSKALFAMKEAMEILQRKAFGPRLKGAQSAPLLAQAVEDAAAPVAAKAGGPTGMAAIRVLKAIFSDEKAVAETVSTPEGWAVLSKALQVQAGVIRGTGLSGKLVNAFTAAATRAGFGGLLAKPDTRRPDDHRFAGGTFTVDPTNLQGARVQ
jgi:hypothetical protein